MLRRYFLTLMLLVSLVCGHVLVGWGQVSTSMLTSQPLPTLESVAERKRQLQTLLKNLEQSNLSKEEQDKASGQLNAQFDALSAFEEATQRLKAFQTQISQFNQHLRAAEAIRRQLENRDPTRFPQITDSLRAEYEAQRQALEKELENLRTQATTGGVRLAHLSTDIRQRQETLDQLERDYQAETSLEGNRLASANLLEAQIQAHRVNIDALEAERQWLTMRGPLHDALLANTQLRLSHVQDDLLTIQTALAEAVQAEQQNLNEEATQLQQALATSTDPAEKLMLQVQLQTIVVQQQTVTYQQQVTKVSEAVHKQDIRNARVRQDTNRLTSLIEKYSSGERVVQGILVGFERLRRDRQRAIDNPLYALQSPLRIFTRNETENPLQALEMEWSHASDALFTVDDRLYEFDRYVHEQEEQLTTALASAPPRKRDAALSTLRSDLEQHRRTLREQQQVLTLLTQSTAQLIALHREHTRLLDEGYRLVLSKMFWLKNSATLSWSLVPEMLSSTLSIVSGITTAVRSDLIYLASRLKQSVAFWGVAVLLVILIPWVAWRIRRNLGQTIKTYFGEWSQPGSLPSLWILILLAIQALVWPLYLALLSWSRHLFIPQDTNNPELLSALVQGLYTVALIFAIGAFLRALLRAEGWAERFWELSSEVRRMLRRAITTGCIAGIVFLVPRQIVLSLSADPELSSGGQTLARLLFLAFQIVIFMLILRVGWRSSPLMDRVLSRSREQDGLLWRIWPFIHLGLLCAISGVMLLDVLGYRYAAQFVWLNSLESLSIALVFRLVLLLLVVHLIQKVVRGVYNLGRRRRDPQREQSEQRSLSVLRFVAQLILAVMALTLILELWGVSVWNVFTSQLGSQIATRAFICLITIGLAVVIIQVSNVLAEYILRPRLNAQGETLEMGRQLRTLTPLVQTILKVVVAFVAILILLEQVNIQTGPILAGVGIFGLAIGFASQSLIKDVINGLFILFEDSISVGDITTIRGIGGAVEKITLRAVTIRDLHGDVHVIPNSTIDMVTNKSKVFSRYLLDVGVAYREDVDAVMDILREIDQDMRDDPQFRYQMLEPIEMWGLDRFADSAVYVRARLKTQPGKQWVVGREFNRRMKKVFDERNIEIPFPHRTLYWGQPKTGDQPPIPLSVDRRNQRLPENGSMRDTETD